MSELPSPTVRSLFMFIDESGNFDFSARGTTHFLMAGVVALEPYLTSVLMQRLRYKMLAQGHDIEYLHASEDRQVVRDEVFSVLSSIEGLKAHVIYGDKRRAAPSIQSEDRIYYIFAKALIKYLIKVHTPAEYDQVVVVLDKALNRRKQGEFEQAVKPLLKELKKPFRLFFHSVRSDYNAQIADYIAWAKFVALERDEQRPWAALNGLAVTDFDIFRKGHTLYY